MDAFFGCHCSGHFSSLLSIVGFTCSQITYGYLPYIVLHHRSSSASSHKKMHLRGWGERPNRPQTWLRRFCPQSFFSLWRTMDLRLRPPRWLNPRWLWRLVPIQGRGEGRGPGVDALGGIDIDATHTWVKSERGRDREEQCGCFHICPAIILTCSTRKQTAQQLAYFRILVAC